MGSLRLYQALSRGLPLIIPHLSLKIPGSGALQGSQLTLRHALAFGCLSLWRPLGLVLGCYHVWVQHLDLVSPYRSGLYINYLRISDLFFS